MQLSAEYRTLKIWGEPDWSVISYFVLWLSKYLATDITEKEASAGENIEFIVTLTKDKVIWKHDIKVLLESGSDPYNLKAGDLEYWANSLGYYTC